MIDVGRPRWSEAWKKWWVPAVLLCIVLCIFIIFNFSHLRRPQENLKIVAPPLQPKLTRPLRPNAAPSKRTREINKKAGPITEVAAPQTSSCRKTTFDESTGTLRWEIDSNCDGRIDYCYVADLNEYGEEVRNKLYEGCGTKPSFCVENIRDEYGDVTMQCHDTDCDGRFEGCRILIYNDHGDVVETIVDYGNDGRLDGEFDEHQCYSYSYDEEGRIIKEEEGRCGQTPELCKEFEYDNAARIHREKWDHKCDGVVDLCWVIFFRNDPDEYDQFVDKGCTGTWLWCGLQSDDGTVRRFNSHEACALKYEELVKRNQEMR